MKLSTITTIKSKRTKRLKSIKYIPVVLLITAISFNASAAKKKTLVYCSEGSPSSFNPQISTDGTTFNASSKPIYNRLVEFKRGETKIVPALATSWNFDKKTLSYTFKLRKGVKWHKTKYFTPTRDFNADDVLFSFNRQRLKKHPYHAVGGGSYEYFSSMGMNEIIKDIKKVDNYTVIFVLSKKYTPFMANLAMDFASILSKEYADNLLKKGKSELIDIHPIGTGPFIYKKYQKDSVIRYIVNKEYWAGRSPLDQLVFSITVDPSVRFQKLKTGECHLITEPSPVDLAAMKKHPKIKVMQRPGLNVGYLAMNVEKKPFNDVRVRKAIHLALNRESYIKAVYLNHAIVAKNPIPPTIWSYNDDIKDYKYDKENKRAKKLMKQAGYPNGFSTELWTLPVSRPYNPNGKKMGELMQADLAKIGIKVKLVSYDWPTYLAKSKAGKHQMLQLGWTGDNGDPDNFLNTLLSCNAVKSGANRARWCNTEFDNSIIAAMTIDKRDKRVQKYRQAQKTFKDQAPWVTIAHSIVYRSMRKNVKGYKIDPFGADIFYGVDLK